MASSDSKGKTIAIAVDASDHSERAFDWFMDQLYREGDKLIVIHSHELHPPALPPVILSEKDPLGDWSREKDVLTTCPKAILRVKIYQFGFVDAMATEEWKKEVQKHEEYIKNLEDKYKKKCLAVEVPAKILVQDGHPGENVCKTALKEKANLIVVGSRGMGTIRRTILGSISDYIIHHAHIPVLVVPKV
ncbi:Universal stress protein [Acropora cervicornis]|uniref:Universal stress protein n=1 Tax=Acropora cervicornis TaxID=6130 RepID=A0AAD9R0E5_ACRCE|nr:Universal stress protein [Acropora cervicornis]